MEEEVSCDSLAKYPFRAIGSQRWIRHFELTIPELEGVVFPLGLVFVPSPKAISEFVVPRLLSLNADRFLSFSQNGGFH